MAVFLAGEQLHPDLLLGHQEVFAQRVQGAVVSGFLAAVVAFGRGGEDFDEQGGIEQGIELSVLEPRLA